MATEADDVATKAYVDAAIGGGGMDTNYLWSIDGTSYHKISINDTAIAQIDLETPDRNTSRVILEASDEDKMNRVMVRNDAIKAVTVATIASAVAEPFMATEVDDIATKAYVDSVVSGGGSNPDYLWSVDDTEGQFFSKSAHTGSVSALIELEATDDSNARSVQKVTGTEKEVTTVEQVGDSVDTTYEIFVGAKNSIDPKVSIQEYQTRLFGGSTVALSVENTSVKALDVATNKPFVASEPEDIATKEYVDRVIPDGAKTLYTVNVHRLHNDLADGHYSTIDYLIPTYPGGGTTPTSTFSTMTGTFKLSTDISGAEDIGPIYQAIAKDYGFIRNVDGYDVKNVLPFYGRYGIYDSLWELQTSLNVHGLAIYPNTYASGEGQWAVEWFCTSDDGKDGSIIFFYEANHPSEDIYADWQAVSMFKFGDDPHTASTYPFLGSLSGTVSVL